MEILKNIIINTSENQVFVYHSTAIIPNYSGTDEDTITFVDNSKLDPELTDFINLATTDYILSGETLNIIQYQNKSQSFVYDSNGNLVERFQVISKEGTVSDPWFIDLPTDLQQKISAFGDKIVQVIQGGN